MLDNALCVGYMPGFLRHWLIILCTVHVLKLPTVWLCLLTSLISSLVVTFRSRGGEDVDGWLICFAALRLTGVSLPMVGGSCA
jgi:hypothetical protein